MLGNKYYFYVRQVIYFFRMGLKLRSPGAADLLLLDRGGAGESMLAGGYRCTIGGGLA